MEADLGFWEIALRLGAAAVLAGALGFEREADGHEAGFRTHVLLALGAALFGLISVGAFDEFVAERARSNIQIDVTRVASYVAVGAGFLGAGSILKGPGGVRGLTTAASLWSTTAIGLAAGLGFWAPAILATAAALASLVLLKPVRALAVRYRGQSTAVATIVLAPGAAAGELVRALEGARGVWLSRVELEGTASDGRRRVRASLEAAAPGRLAELIEELATRDAVASVAVERTRHARRTTPLE